MKKLMLAFLLVICFIIPSTALAAPSDTTLQENKVYEGQIQLEDQKYPLSQYRLETQIDGGGITGLTNMGEKAMAGINDGLWSVNKQIANFTGYAVSELLSYDLISQIIDQTAQISNNVYESMSGLFLPLFISIAAGTAAYRFFVNRQEASAYKAIGGTILIMVTMLWFFSNTTNNIQLINSFSSQIDGTAMSTNVLVSNKSVNTSQPRDSKEGTALLRNQLFELMVYRPYLLLQYGTTKESDINSQDSNRVVGLLSIKTYGKDALAQRSKVVDNEVNLLGNIPMSPGDAGERFGQILLTIFLTIIVSIPVLIMAGTAFILQVFLICLLIFAAIPLVMSVIPSFAPTASNFFKKLVGLILHKAALILVISVALGISTLVYNTTDLSSGLEGYMLMAFVNALIIFAVFKFRIEILEIVSLGAIAGNHIAERVTSNTIQGVTSKGQDAVSKGKEFIAKRIQNKNKQSSSRNTESPSSQAETDQGNKRFIVVKGGNRANQSTSRSSSESTSQSSTASKTDNTQPRSQSHSRNATETAGGQNGAQKQRVSIYPTHSSEQVAATSEGKTSAARMNPKQPKRNESK